MLTTARSSFEKVQNEKGPPGSSYLKSLKEQAKNGGGFSFGGGRGGDFYYPPTVKRTLAVLSNDRMGSL